MINIDKNFNEEVLNYEGNAIVDFWASWCGPCKMFGPIFDKTSKSNKNFKFCKLNIDEDKEEISKKFGVMSIPTAIIFKNGKEIKRNVGFMSEEELLNFLEEK